ncbi:MAG TPA: oligopeptide transporter, OPT family [Fimbriiglobus sp.]|nr:oligopeptide transporter, OPT family [Fimbriiglobus sp.]
MATDPEPTPAHQPYVPPEKSPPEFTWPAVVAGTLLGILFGASSLYLVLKVGLTVSASVPIAVLSITLFRAFSKGLGVRNATILENNITQTTGSAGESIAFGVGVTMPALFLLGFELDPVRVMTVSVLGGLLGILMMIPLRRAFIVKQHGKLAYPEGTACAEVLIAGEKGGATAKMVFVGFGVAFAHKLLTAAGRLWAGVPTTPLYTVDPTTGAKSGLVGAKASGELSPELLGVGFLIGPRIASLMMAGAVMSYFVLGPAIATFGATASEPVAPATWDPEKPKDTANPGLIRNMDPDELQRNYLRYIGAGAVAAGGIISMCKALPLIVGSVVAGLRDLRAARAGAPAGARTERDLPITVVLFGCLGLVIALAAVPQLHLGLSVLGILGAVMILLFGFLFVTVSSRLTGEVGSSSNPISGMTIATLLLVCAVFLLLGKRDATAMLTALTVASVVCIASSNGGTTSQDLKTGYLVGATPYKQQWAIAVGAITSAVVIGLTMLALNAASTHYTKKGLPARALDIPSDAPRERPGKPYQDDQTEYRIVHARNGQYPDVKPGRYLVDEAGRAVYRTDEPIARENKTMDDGNPAPKEFTAPQPRLFANIIEGILGGTLEWALIVTGVLIAVVLELCGVSALPVAVGMYLSLSSTTPIFIGGLLRLIADRLRGRSGSGAAAETSPGLLLASGLIAGGTLCGLLVSFFPLFSEAAALVGWDVDFGESLDVGRRLFGTISPETGKLAWDPDTVGGANVAALAAFGVLAALLLWVGSRKGEVNGE